MRWLSSYFDNRMENLKCLTFLLGVGDAIHTSREYENYCLHSWAQWPGESRARRFTWSYCDQGVGRVRVSDSGRCLCVWTFPWDPKEGAPGFLVSFLTSGKRESPDIGLMTKMCSVSFNWIWACLVSQDGPLWGLQPEASKRKVKVPMDTLFKSLVCFEKLNACLFHSQKWLKLRKWTGTVFGEVTYCGYRRCGNVCVWFIVWVTDTKEPEFWVVCLFFTSKGATLSRDQTARQWLREWKCTNGTNFWSELLVSDDCLKFVWLFWALGPIFCQGHFGQRMESSSSPTSSVTWWSCFHR